MSKQVYIVMAADFNYNDEYYYQDGEGGVPNTVFDNVVDAEKTSEVLNAMEFKGLMISQYGEEIEGLCKNGNVDETVAAINDIIGDEENRVNEELEIPDDLTDVQYMKIADLFDLKFYYVQACDKG